MGLLIPKVPGGTPEKTDFHSSIAVLSPPTEQAPGGPDACLLSRAEFPQREMPQVTGGRESRYQTVFKQSVLDEIRAHGESSPEAEVCGVLVGDVYADRMACWAYIEHAIRGNNAVGKQTQVTFKDETWTHIHKTLDKEFPGKKIVGWYHTHPGFGVFLSGMDLFIQDNFFNQPWQIATVYDPKSQDLGTFIWRNGKSVRENILVEQDTPIVVPSAQAPGTVDELTRRVKRLERRMDWLMTAFLLTVLAALIAPLIVFAVAPEYVKRVLRPPPPTTTTTPVDPAPKPASPATVAH